MNIISVFTKLLLDIAKVLNEYIFCLNFPKTYNHKNFNNVLFSIDFEVHFLNEFGMVTFKLKFNIFTS